MKRALLSLLGVQLGAFALTLWGSFGIALGLNPESFQTLDALAPLLGLGVVAFYAGRGASWHSGVAVSLPNIGFWLVMHVFVSTRFHLEFWRDGVSQLGFSHLFWWTLAVGIALAGAWCGANLKRSAFAIALVPLALLLVFLAQLATPRDSAVRYEADGTSIRLREFDLKSVDFGVYDADSDDAHPEDNRNSTWLSQAMPRVWSKIASRNGEPLCVVNGGFFGATDPLLAQHEAPLSIKNRLLYDVGTLQDDWPMQNAALVWKRDGDATTPQIVRGATFATLRQYEGVLGGVRVLIANGQNEPLKPGMGGTTLKCCRTSVAWNARTGKFWLLSVRDPDGEASSVRGNTIEKRTGRAVQVGGWNVSQVQQFWQAKGATDAVLFDGGESGQIAYRNANGQWQWIHSSYHLSRTLGFIREKPLRAVLPMLPPPLANGGVLNWFYIKNKARETNG